ncbi:hypothetical protein [Streptomyces sp. ME19-01-6]|uniref:hypothetical protein n=1 Tax=Streptomyces sp. ME19-01-6 TaxID=3028686 RepID=UPI0029AB49DA|nr:hypothetical protein [Streptomyces sp. ME19-01-6]MDX3230143.1 hypothetical protein [Streptomyces sp. ME19-01-6]
MVDEAMLEEALLKDKAADQAADTAADKTDQARPATPATPAALPAPVARGHLPAVAGGARRLREALRQGGEAFPAALREADDGLLLSALDDGMPADRATRVVVELVRRAPERGPELADAVCEKVLLARLYLDAGEQPGADDRLRARNALMLYDGLVRPCARRGGTPELLACVVPALWAARGGAGREVVRRIVDSRQPTGFGERAWKELFTGAAEECREHEAAAVTAARRGARRWWPRSRRPGRDGGRIDLQPGQLWVAVLLGLISVALVLIVVLAAR